MSGDGKWHGGKGSNPRPFAVDSKTYEDNWDRIFGKKKENPIDDKDTENHKGESPDRDNMA